MNADGRPDESVDEVDQMVARFSHSMAAQPVPLTAQRDRLRAAAGRRSRSRGWPMVVLAAAATAAAVGAVSVAIPAFRTAERPNHPSATALANSAPPAPKTIVLPGRPPKGALLFAETQVFANTECVGDVCSVVRPTVRRAWLSVDGAKDGRVDQVQRGQNVSEPLPGCRSRTTGKGKAGKATCDRAGVDRSDLPADVTGMSGHLARVASTGGKSLADREFKAAAEVEMETYVPPKVAAAVFGAARAIPGVTVKRGMTDPAGRPAVSLVLAPQPSDWERHEYFFDPRTFQMTGTRDVAVANRFGVAKGTVTYADAVTWLAYVDHVGQIPR
jgi:hypothetical protein